MLGTWTIGAIHGGGGIDSKDDVMPTAWEETWGNAISTSVNLHKGSGSAANIMWTSPSMGKLWTERL